MRLLLKSLPESAVAETRSFSVQTNKPDNLIVIRYAGRIRPSDVEACCLAIRSALAQFDSGFRLLVDLTELESMDPACLPHIRQIMQLCNAKGVATVARVVPDPARDLGLQIMSYFHYNPAVQTITCTSLDEAENALAE